MVRKVVAYELLSLDGVAEQPDEFITDFDDPMQDNLDRVIATQDTVLLGRRTYDDWAEFWPPSNMQRIVRADRVDEVTLRALRDQDGRHLAP